MNIPRKILTVLFVTFASILWGQDVTQNYVKTEEYLNHNGTNKRTTVQYFDYYGRSSQKVTDGFGNGNFVHIIQTYDEKNRERTTYLPVVGGNMPNHLDDPDGFSYDTYSDDNAFSTKYYDALDRVIVTTTPGDAWWENSNYVCTNYKVNKSNSVKRYVAPLGENYSLTQNGFYPAGSLQITETIDEDGNTLETFVDKLGQKILERRNNNNDTYFVYNDLCQLRFVLSPEYQKSGYKSVYAYEYRYDERGRVVKKILPQCEYIQYWYDNADRLLFLQNARLREKGLYRFFLHDALGRLTVQGTCTNCNRGTYNIHTIPTENMIGGICNTGYNLSKSGIITNPVLEQVFYYDNYNFLNNPIFSNSSFFVELGGSSITNTKGLKTGSIIATGDERTQLSTCYYDWKGRQTDYKQTHPDGYFLHSENSYTYTDKPSILIHSLYNKEKELLHSVSTTYSYDDATDKLSIIDLKVNGSETRRITRNSYDELGRLITKTRSGNAGTISYSYNLHGWITNIAGKGFSQSLYYTDGLGEPYYNGNVSSMTWKTDNENFIRGYKFSYDGLNRLTTAIYGEGLFLDDHTNRYSERVLSYNENGVIKKFHRHGLKSDGIYGKIDNLDITVDGNRIIGVKDEALPVLYNGAFDYIDETAANSGHEYTYDKDGYLQTNADRGIAFIKYDIFGNLQKIQFTNGSTTEYVYGATGNKLSILHRTAVIGLNVTVGDTLNLTNANTLATDKIAYVGPFRIRNGFVEKFMFEGGYCTFNGTSTAGKLHYYTKDHLGNNRVVVDEDGTLEQVTHYYPFGGIFGDAGLNTGLQPYKFGDKELERMHGLDWYDFGSRMYDPVLALFTSIDPQCEKNYHVSPYLYCEDNPIIRVDKNGEFWDVAWDIANLLYDVGTAVYHHTTGEHDKAISNWEDAGADVLSALIPGIPAGISKTTKVAKNPATKTIRKISPNEGKGRPHGGEKHNKAIDDYIENIRKANVEDIRKNQKQVDIDGNTVGRNRPDVQYNKDDVHYNVEFDTKEHSSEVHKKVIEKNDPNSQNEFIILK